MKRILTAAVVLAASTLTTQAQETETTESASFLPSKGSVTAEVGLNLLGDGNTVEFNSYTNGVKARYFLNSNLAIRFGLGLNMANTTEYVTPGFFPGSDTLPTGTRNYKSNQLIITPGIEYHFNKYERISPYVGLDFIYSKKTVNEDLENAQMIQNFGFFPPSTGEWMLVYANKYQAENENGTAQGERSGTTIGLRLLAGVDYFLTKSFYMGTEFGFDYTKTTNEDYKQTVTYFNWQTQADKTESRTTPGGESTNTKASILKGIRIGFRF